MTGEPENASLKKKVGLYALAMNYLPFLHLLMGGALVWHMETVATRIAAGALWIYLLPPLVARLTLLVFGYPLGRALPAHSRRFRVWWFLTQVQMIFNRLPWLEEILRLVPGLYSLWLNLWGSRVGVFVFWAPGIRILDRYLLKIDNGVIISGSASLTGHISILDKDKNYVTDIDFITIEKGALIGARSGIAPGCVIGANEMLPAGRLLQPYSEWREGKKIRKDT